MALEHGEVLWRRVMPASGQLNEDGTAKSSAFKTEQLSVHRAKLTSVEAILKDYPTAHLFEFTVGDALDAGVTNVTDDKQPGDTNDHGVVYGATKSSVARRLRDKAKKIWPTQP